jgi:hypothetical protein
MEEALAVNFAGFTGVPVVLGLGSAAAGEPETDFAAGTDGTGGFTSGPAAPSPAVFFCGWVLLGATATVGEVSRGSSEEDGAAGSGTTAAVLVRFGLAGLAGCDSEAEAGGSGRLRFTMARA